MGCDNNITDKCKLVKRDGTEYYLIDRMDEVREEMLNLLRIVDDICNKENLKILDRWRKHDWCYKAWRFYTLG